MVTTDFSALPLKLVNVICYIGLLSSNSYANFMPRNNHSRGSYLAPAAFVFQIWWATNLLLLGYIILQFFDVGHNPIVKVVKWRFAAISILNAVFVTLFAHGNYIVAFVVSLFWASLISHVYWDLKAKHKAESNWDLIFVHLPFSLWHAWSIVLVLLSGFAAFGRTHSHHAGVVTKVLVCLALGFLALTSVGYAFTSTKGDVAGAAVIAWTLWGIYVQQQIPVIHWFALGAAIVSILAVLKALIFGVRSPLVASDNERAPLISNSG